MKVIIIGAGIAGLSIGWRLAEAGVDTVVLERGQPGRGATWASAGMLAATAESGTAPPAEAAFAKKSAALWPDFASRLEAISGTKVGYRCDGTLLVARNAADAEAYRARAAENELRFLEVAEARTMEPLLSNDFHGALWAPEDGQVDNRALGRALSVALLRAGGTLLANEAAIRIETLANGIMAVCTPFGMHEADAIVLAAGAWSGQIAGLPPDAIPPVRPVKGEMIALAPPSGVSLPTRLVWGNEVYLVPRREQLFVGATVREAGFDTALTAEARAWLFAHAAGLMPALAGWTIAEHWAGLRPGSPDGLPVLGATTVKGLYVASGQYRNGILFAPAIAEATHDFLLARRSPVEIAAFDPKRFQIDAGGAARNHLR